MAGFSLGFGSGGSRRQYGYSGGGGGGGLLGPLGSSIAATMSPDREPGVGGVVRAFLDPEPVRLAEMQRRTMEGRKPAIEQSSKLTAEAMKMIMLEDWPGAVQALDAARNGMLNSGIDQDDFSLKSITSMLDFAARKKAEKLDPTSETFETDYYRAATGAGLDKATEALDMQGRRRANQAHADLYGAQTQEVEELLPGKKAQQGYEADLTQAQTDTQRTMQDENRAQAALYGAQTTGEGVETDIKRQELSSIRDKGYRIPTGPPDRQTTNSPYLDDQSRVMKNMQDTIADINTPKESGGIIRRPSREQIQAQVDNINEQFRQVELRYGTPQPYLEIEDVMTEPVPDDERPGQMYPGKKFARVRMMQPGERRGGRVDLPPGAGQPPGPGMTALSPQEQQRVMQNLTDADLDRIQIDPTSFTAAQSKLHREINAETQAGKAELKKQGATAADIRKYERAQALKLVRALAAGGQ